MNEMSALIQETRESSFAPSTVWGDRKLIICKAESNPHQTMDLSMLWSLEL